MALLLFPSITCWVLPFYQAGYAEKIANVWETVAEETSGYAKHGS